MQRNTLLPLLSILLIELSGCVSPPGHAHFDDVEKLVADRTSARVRWNRGSEDDRAAHDAVRALLKRDISIDDATQIALLNNRNLQGTFEEIGIAQADLVAAGLLKNPIFSGDVRFDTSGGGTALELSIVQNFMELIQIPLRRRIAAAGLEATKRRVARAAIRLASDVRQAYLQLQSNLHLLEHRRAAVETLATTLELAQRLHDAGNIADLELARETAMYEQSKLEVASAELRVIESRERMNSLMGLSGPDTKWTIPPHLPDLPEKELITVDLEDRAVERSLDLAESRERIAQQADRAGIARSTALFSEAEIGAKAERDSDGRWGVGPAFSIPIPLFDNGRARQAAARAELRESQQRYTAQIVEIRAEVRAAHAKLKLARERVQTMERIILPLHRRILEETQKQLNAMHVGVFQLLEAKRQEVEAGAQQVEALRDYWLGRNRVEQVLAGLRMSIDGGD